MHRFVSSRSFAVLVAPIFLSILVFNHLKKKKKSAEKESIEGASAPSSSFVSAIPTEGDSDQYDVFLSFRGSDTRNGFTDHLYHSLSNAGIRICVFRDENSIPIGKEFGSQILGAITRSKISIPIISENYASSKWCLRELIHMMDYQKSTSHEVLPIFYKVNPSDVRYLKGSFGKVFDSHKKHFDAKDVQEGPRALKEVSNLNGWESENIANGREGELIKIVVRTVQSVLKRYFKLNVPKELVGIDGHLKEIMSWVDSPSVDAQMIGIYGMGGIGKTTLAKCIYNQLSNKFEQISFLQDVRETTKRHGIEYLQSQLISDILLSQREVSSVDDGINIIETGFQEKKVLILLDDIDHKDQLDALTRERNWFMAGSLIIVTTRYETVLDQSEFEVGYKYELKEMDDKHSLLLFNRHAFRMDHPPRDFEGISGNIISTLGGLPLALQVIGSYLYGKTDKKIWHNILMKLKKGPHRDVQKILKISYDVLEREHQEIFLDIACFLIGKKCNFAIYMWEDCEFYASQGIEELMKRCLIKIGDDGKLGMHDQLRDLGRNIVCREGSPERRSRLWVYEQALEVLMGKKGTEMVRAICLDKYPDRPLFTGSVNHQTYTSDQFQNLESLRFLQLRRVALSGDFNNLFSELRWLQWFGIEKKNKRLAIFSKWCFPSNDLHLPSLVVLQLSDEKITEHWRGWSSIKAAKRLKVLDLTRCENLRCTHDFSTNTELEVLILKDCFKLKQVHPSIGKLKRIVSLDLRCCHGLKDLPEEVGELAELKELLLDHAGITKIPMSIGSLSKLEKLSAYCCGSLCEIPSFGNISSLQHLNLRYCHSLREIPSSIGNLSSLQHLDLKGCQTLIEIPSSIGNISSLQYLDLHGCVSLREIPSSIGNLSSLQHLDLCFRGSSTGFAAAQGDLQASQGYFDIDNPFSAFGRLKMLLILCLHLCLMLLLVKLLVKVFGEMKKL